jgi:hypothetical protein
MTLQPLAYALIRFLPYPDGEEFVNIGVVLVSPKTGYFDFRLETQRFERVTAFFEAFDPTVLRAVLHRLNTELARVRKLAASGGKRKAKDESLENHDARHLFDALTKDRAGIVRYSDVRLALHANPQEMLDELFGRYVTRSSPATIPATA